MKYTIPYNKRWFIFINVWKHKPHTILVFEIMVAVLECNKLMSYENMKTRLKCFLTESLCYEHML